MTNHLTLKDLNKLNKKYPDCESFLHRYDISGLKLQEAKDLAKSRRHKCIICGQESWAETCSDCEESFPIKKQD